MPITENELSYEDMQKIVWDGHTCACGGRLNIAWGSYLGYDCYILRCGKDITHNKINRHDKQYEEKIKTIKEIRGMDTTALQKMDEQTMLARIESARFPQELKAADKKLLAIACITYGFDPIMGELTIYQGNPYVSIDGRYRKAQETGELDGVESRPATKQERDNWQIPEGDYFFRAEVYKRGSTRPFVGWGRVRKQETIGGKGFKPIETNPQRMAEKRAEAQALRKAFHIPLPSAEYIGTEDDDTIVVNTSTGEIIEAEAKEVPEEKVEPKETLNIDMDWLKESLEELQWVDVVKYLKDKYGVKGNKVSDILYELTPEQREEFVEEVNKRIQGD